MSLPATSHHTASAPARRGLLALGAGWAASLLAPGLARSTPGEIGVGASLPDAALDGLNGPPRRLRQFRGRPLLINVWASWCGPCVAEMASLERLARWANPASLILIGISTDDEPAAARAVLQRTGATIPHFIDHDQALENLLGAAQLPLTVLVDARGRILDKLLGARAWDAAAYRAALARAFSLAW